MSSQSGCLELTLLLWRPSPCPPPNWGCSPVLPPSLHPPTSASSSWRCLQLLLPRLYPGPGPKVTSHWLSHSDPTQESHPWQSLERQAILWGQERRASSPFPLCFWGLRLTVLKRVPKTWLKKAVTLLTMDRFLQNLSLRILLSQLRYIRDVTAWIFATRRSKSWVSAFLWILASIVPQPKLEL